MLLRRTIAGLLIGAVGLPILTTVLVGLGRLLAAMGDEAGAAGVGRFALAAAVVWVVVLISLVLTQAAGSLLAGDEPREPPLE